jgi:hypothetical protein
MKKIEIKDLKKGQVVYEFINIQIGFVKCIISEDARRVEDHEIYNDGDDIGPGWICFCENGTRLYAADDFQHMGPKLYVEVDPEHTMNYSYVIKHTPEELDEKLMDYLSFIDEKIVIANGFSEAFIGTTGSTTGIVAVYSIDKIIKILMERYKMPYDEALEYAEYNIISAYVSDRTPLFLDYVSENQWNF